MRSNSALSMRGDIEIRVRDTSTGDVVREYAVKNKIVDTGVAAVAKLLAQTSGTASSYKLAQLKVGTGTTLASAGQTDLVSPVLANGTVTLTTSDVVATDNKVVVKGTVPSAIASAITLREVGLFMSNGQLFARQIHSGITTGSGLSVEYTWTLTFTAA